MKEKKEAIRFIVLLGIISLVADISYEGMRSIIGPYLSLVGATGASLGIVVGLGEFIGYGFRAVSGYLSDRTKRYWDITFFGYILSLFSVPFLALASTWQYVGLIVVLERLGKAIRGPARDALLSYATKQTGRGWGFGLHEALDQIGAVLGPLIIMGIIFFASSYRMAFGFMIVPALVVLFLLILAIKRHPKPQRMEPAVFSLNAKGLNKNYWIYTLGVALVGAGYADFAIIAYHFQKTNLLNGVWIPLLYGLAMGVDGLSALVMGRIFDKKGVLCLVFVTLLSCLFAPLVFFAGFYGAVLGMILWGIGMGGQESIMRAAVAMMVPPHKRGTAYGLFNLIFGIFWALGSMIMGVFYDISLSALVIFSISLQLLSIPFFLYVRGKVSTH